MYKSNDIVYSLKRYSDLEKGVTQIPNDIFRIVESSYQLTVYTYLCYKYDKEYQYVSPSLKTIADDTHVSISTVRRVIKELEELKLIKILKPTEKTNQYANNMYRIYYPVIDYESSQIEDENNLFLSEEQLAELEEIENGIYEIKIDKVQKVKRDRPNNNEKWRKNVLKRDNNTCQLCHCNNSTMHVHHIRKWIDYPELRTDVNNGITLCEKCHYKIYGKEKEYEEHFLQIIANRILSQEVKNND